MYCVSPCKQSSHGGAINVFQSREMLLDHSCVWLFIHARVFVLLRNALIYTHYHATAKLVQGAGGEDDYVSDWGELEGWLLYSISPNHNTRKERDEYIPQLCHYLGTCFWFVCGLCWRNHMQPSSLSSSEYRIPLEVIKDAVTSYQTMRDESRVKKIGSVRKIQK